MRKTERKSVRKIVLLWVQQHLAQFLYRCGEAAILPIFCSPEHPEVNNASAFVAVTGHAPCETVPIVALFVDGERTLVVVVKRA